MQSWLLTNTTYGTWLPGDARGSYTDVSGQTALTSPQPKLAQHARAMLKDKPIRLTQKQADVLLTQLLETAEYRSWQMLAVSIMANHFHLVTLAADDVPPKKLLADFKAYGSRALNLQFGQPNSSGKWWTTNGSKRYLPDQRAVAAAVNYVINKQTNPLMTWWLEGEELW